MSKLFNKKTQFIVQIYLLISVLVGFSYISFSEFEVGIIFTLFVLLVGFVGIAGGAIFSTGLSIVLLFLVGSTFFWGALTDTVFSLSYDVSIQYIIYWMVAQFIVALVSGRLSLLMSEMIEENRLLRQEIRTLVAVDRVTGFDNKERMLVELELEFNRSKRYGNPFSLLVIKWTYFEQFEKLYGEGELEQALRHISRQLYKLTRSSDQRFRPEENVFAILLTNTEKENAERVIEKINRDISVFELQNKKLVTLSFEFGFVGYDDSIGNFLELYESALDQVDSHV